VTGAVAGATDSTVSVTAGTASLSVSVTGVSAPSGNCAIAGEAVKATRTIATTRARLRGIGVIRDARAAPADPRVLLN
jgi:hypothetical protein